MYRIGLTGGIASGKSTVARVLASRGAAVIDADGVARELVEPGEAVLSRLVDAFGDDILRGDGSLDRGELASRAFASPEGVARLNSITHPALVSRIIERMEELERSSTGSTCLLVVDAALLAEWDVLDLFDRIVVVDAPVAVRVRRLVGGGMSEQEARDRMSAQLPPQVLREVADDIIWNDGSPEELRAKAEELARRLLEECEREPGGGLGGRPGGPENPAKGED